MILQKKVLADSKGTSVAGLVVYYLHGELTINAVVEKTGKPLIDTIKNSLHNYLTNGVHKPVVVDCREVKYIDTSMDIVFRSFFIKANNTRLPAVLLVEAGGPVDKMLKLAASSVLAKNKLPVVYSMEKASEVLAAQKEGFYHDPDMGSVINFEKKPYVPGTAATGYAFSSQ